MRLRIDMAPLQMVTAMSEGNAGALTVCMELIKTQAELGYIAIMKMDDMRIYGCNIWIAFKDYCNEDIEKLYNAIMEMDAGLMAYMKRYIIEKERLDE